MGCTPWCKLQDYKNECCPAFKLKTKISALLTLFALCPEQPGKWAGPFVFAATLATSVIKQGKPWVP